MLGYVYAWSCASVIASLSYLLPSYAFVLLVTVFTFISFIALFVYRYQEPVNYFLLAVFVSKAYCMFP